MGVSQGPLILKWGWPRTNSIRLVGGAGEDVLHSGVSQFHSTRWAREWSFKECIDLPTGPHWMVDAPLQTV